MLFLTQGGINWRFTGKLAAFVILFISLFFLPNYCPGDSILCFILLPLVGIMAFTFLIAFFLDVFRRIRKKPELPISKEIIIILRMFLLFVCLLPLGLICVTFIYPPESSSPLLLVIWALGFFIFLCAILVWWLGELISLIVKLIKKQKASKFQIILFLILSIILLLFLPLFIFSMTHADESYLSGSSLLSQP